MNDFMTGTSSSAPIYSAVSLALFEDSGWYTVDYAAAQSLAGGKGMGCNFATNYCNNWPTAARDAGMFCSTAGAKSCAGSVSQYKGYCNLASYSSSLPSQNRYFSDSSKGGQDQLADYCPYITAYSNGDCRLAENAPSNNYYAETYEADSRCFSHNLLLSGYVWNADDVSTGCYQTSCSTSNGQA